MRTLTLTDGETITERLEQASDVDRSYTYTLLESPLPVADYQATLSVSDAGTGRCLVPWSSRFRRNGIAAEQACEAVAGLYQAGLDALKARVAA